MAPKNIRPTESARFSRRSLLQISAATALAAGVSLERAHAQVEKLPGKAPGKRQPKNIIFMVSDGMSAGVLRLGQMFAQLNGKKDSNWARLMTDPDAVHGLFDMSSLDSCVTDSAAASSSWGSGSRVPCTWLNILPDGTKLTPIAQVAQSAGKRVGLVTTATVSHATPAGFAACSDQRNDEAHIAPQYRGVVDVIMGGGLSIVDKAMREDFARAGYAIALTPKAMLKAQGAPRMLGLFADGFLPYNIDRTFNATLQDQVPTLAEMGQSAIRCLSQGKDGFLLQIEGARIDHSCHYNDALALVYEQLAFDDAVGMAYEYVSQRDDTLLIVTADHGNSNPGVLSMGPGGRDSTKYFQNTLAGRASLEQMLKDLQALPQADQRKPEAIVEVMRKGTGAPWTVGQAEAFSVAMQNKRPRLHPQLDSGIGVYGQVMANYHAISFCGTQHTSDNTVITAIGPGAEHFAGLIPNTRAFPVLTELMGKPFKNPSAQGVDPGKLGSLRYDPEQLGALA